MEGLAEYMRAGELEKVGWKSGWEEVPNQPDKTFSGGMLFHL
jgi:hypothetical protein